MDLTKLNKDSVSNNGKTGISADVTNNVGNSGPSFISLKEWSNANGMDFNRVVKALKTSGVVLLNLGYDFHVMSESVITQGLTKYMMESNLKLTARKLAAQKRGVYTRKRNNLVKQHQASGLVLDKAAWDEIEVQALKAAEEFEREALKNIGGLV